MIACYIENEGIVCIKIYSFVETENIILHNHWSHENIQSVKVMWNEWPSSLLPTQRTFKYKMQEWKVEDVKDIIKYFELLYILHE